MWLDDDEDYYCNNLLAYILLIAFSDVPLLMKYTRLMAGLERRLIFTDFCFLCFYSSLF